MTKPTPDQRWFLPRQGLQDLIGSLREKGYQVIGPTVVDGVVMLREIDSVEDLPHGTKDEQDGGEYRLVDGDEALSFEYVVGPDGPKRFLFPPSQPLVRLQVSDEGFDILAGAPQAPKLALLGVRPCELAALEVHDRVFGHDDPATFRCEAEPWYTQVREDTLLLAVNCTRPGGTCFCASWDTGPEARARFDLALTELRDGFVVEVGSERGRVLADELPTREPTGAELELASLKLDRARERMGRQLDASDVKELLDRNIEHPEWDEAAKRCLSCGNCTMVCPTCFCSTVTDATDLADGSITRTRDWESCFTHEFSHTTSGPTRNTIRGRYRHWLRHKLCTWWDQFGTSGCVGCGRCITWCPVGIDLTEEVARIRESPSTASASGQAIAERVPERPL